MNQFKFKLFLLMIFLIYTQGLWERLFFFSSVIQYIIDGSVLAFILFQFRFSARVPGVSLFFFLCVFAFFISFINNDSLLNALFYMRFIIYTYLIYNQLFSKSFTLKQWQRILSFFCVMVLIQGVGSLFSILVLGDRVEGYVGLMSSLGGTTATVFPLIISTLVLIYYLFSSKLNFKTILILSLILFTGFLVGYSSGKRGIYFSIPFVAIITTLLAIPKLRKTSYFKKKMMGLLLIGMLIFPLIIFGIINSRGLNYSLTGNESSFEIILNSLSYADEYENSIDQYGRTIGRSNTSTRILENTFSNPSLLFFGLGFGAIKQDRAMRVFGYEYGIVGFTRDIVSGGFFLSLLTIILMCRIILTNKSILTNVSTITRRSMLIVFLYTHLFYSSDFTVSLKITIILVVLMALINSPVHHINLIELLKKNKLIK